ncbi:MAG: N-acetylglucosamine-6-phosphate deacetylase [Chloroflexota bacterium]
MHLTVRDATSGETITLSIADGSIATVEPVAANTAHWVAPALIDMQVNGYGGFDFNAPNPSAEDAIAAVVALREAGVGLCCPTVTTAGFGHIRRALRAIADAGDQDAATAHAVAGIHLEGPYISPLDGPRGAHPLPYVRPPDWDEFQQFQEAARGTIRLVTLAPELPDAVDLIERLTRDGILVALGHHAATAAELEAAVQAGARMCTHLGNGAHAQLPRHPNYLWDQLGDDRLAAGFILDGHHLPPAVARSMLRVKGLARSILVSDAIYLAGMPPGKAEFMGLQVELTPERRVNLVGTPYLAGSALPLAEGVGNAVRFAGVTLAEALQMATVNPAALLGIDDAWGTLAPGRAADLLVFTWDEAERVVQPEALLARGEVVWGAIPA